MTDKQNKLFLELFCHIDMYKTINNDKLLYVYKEVNETKEKMVLEFLKKNNISSECLRLETYHQIKRWFVSNVLHNKPLSFSDGFNIYKKYGSTFSINLQYKYTEFELIQKGYDVVEWSKGKI